MAKPTIQQSAVAEVGLVKPVVESTQGTVGTALQCQGEAVASLTLEPGAGEDVMGDDQQTRLIVDEQDKLMLDFKPEFVPVQQQIAQKGTDLVVDVAAAAVSHASPSAARISQPPSEVLLPSDSLKGVSIPVNGSDGGKGEVSGLKKQVFLMQQQLDEMQVGNSWQARFYALM